MNIYENMNVNEAMIKRDELANYVISNLVIDGYNIENICYSEIPQCWHDFRDYFNNMAIAPYYHKNVYENTRKTDAYKEIAYWKRYALKALDEIFNHSRINTGSMKKSQIVKEIHRIGNTCISLIKNA